MKVDNRTDLDKMKDDLIECRHKLYNSEAENDYMKNISFIGAAVSFILAMFFGVIAFFFMDHGSGFNTMLSIIVGVWWFSCFGYYGFWRIDINYRFFNKS